jgi:hypothetical protein
MGDAEHRGDLTTMSMIHSKEQLVPGRDDEEFKSKFGDASAAAAQSAEEEEEAEKPLTKEELPEQLQKFIDRRGATEAKPGATAAGKLSNIKLAEKEIDESVERLKKIMLGERDGTNEPRRQAPRPPISSSPRALYESTPQLSLDNALRHFAALADPRLLAVPPTKKASTVIELLEKRFGTKE